MKIGIIVYDLSTLAGGTNLALTLGRELQKEGHEIAYACVYENLEALSKKFNIAPGYKLYASKKPILANPMRTYNALFNHSFPVYQMCKEFKPDVVIETGGFLLSLTVPILLKIPAIYYCMEPEREYAQKSIKNKLYFLPFSAVEKPFLKRVKTCTISDYTGRALQKYANTSFTVIHPPVDTKIFEPGKNREKIILCVLRFVSTYDFEGIIDAFKKLERPDYSLVIIGGLSKENESYFESLKNKIKDAPNIKLMPNADFKTLIDNYKKAMFFWFNSGSPYGIVIAEAQSSGVPTISFGEDSGPGEIIINGKTGYLVQNLAEMVERTEKLLSSKSLWTRMSIAARENALSRFGPDVFVGKFKKVIRDVMRK